MTGQRGELVAEDAGGRVAESPRGGSGCVEADLGAVDGEARAEILVESGKLLGDLPGEIGVGVMHPFFEASDQPSEAGAVGEGQVFGAAAQPLHLDLGVAAGTGGRGEAAQALCQLLRQTAG